MEPRIMNAKMRFVPEDPVSVPWVIETHYYPQRTRHFLKGWRFKLGFYDSEAFDIFVVIANGDGFETEEEAKKEAERQKEMILKN